MPGLIMECIPYDSIISWNDLIQLRSRINEPLRVKVIEVESDVGVDVSQGDELTVGQVNKDRFAASAVSKNDQKDSNEDASLVSETVRSANIPTYFQLYPRHGRDYCFRTVKEIIDTLPAVCKLIFTTDGFEFNGKYVKAYERLEIKDLVRDSATGSRVLLIRSVKTGTEMTLKEDVGQPFFQLPSDCYKCYQSGISASDLLASWIPGQDPFQVKYLSPSSEERLAEVQKKETDLKPGRKNKHRLKISKSINVAQSTTKVLDTFPSHLRDRQLLFRPYHSAVVRNITRNVEDILLFENANLTVRILRSQNNSRSGNSSIKSKLEVSSVGSSEDQLQDIVSKLNWRTTTFLVTAGEVATTLRELDTIRQGHKIVVLMLISTVKAVMVSERNETFLVSTSYGGKFRSGLENHKEMSVEDLCAMQPQFDVEVIAKDENIGHDQLHIRRILKVNELITERTAYVEVFGTDARKLSNQPFEIPLCRSPLHVRVDEPLSIFQSLSLTKAKYVPKLPVVEMVTSADVDAIRSYQIFHDGIRIHQRADEMTHSPHNAEVGVGWSHQGRDDGVPVYARPKHVLRSPKIPEVPIRSFQSPEDHRISEVPIRSFQSQEDAIRSAFNFECIPVSPNEILDSDEELPQLKEIFSHPDMDLQTPVVPPPRPPKSPALLKKEYLRMGGGDVKGELLLPTIVDAPVSPQRPPKPDRFKSPVHGFNSNNNNNRPTPCCEKTSLTTGGRFESGRGEIAIYMPVPERGALQENVQPSKLEIASSEIKVDEKAVQKSSFETLHEFFNPNNLNSQTKPNSKDNSYESLANSNSAEYATYVNPQLLHKQCKSKSKQGVSNPNYEDSIQAVVFMRQSESEDTATTEGDAKSRLRCRNASKNDKEGYYDVAVDPAECHGIGISTLTDDNLDYEIPPKLHSTKPSDARFLTSQDEDYEVATYEKISQ